MDSIKQRLDLLRKFGGLPVNEDFRVTNKEWLYMLEEDARQSLSIEGHFTTTKDLKAVLSGKKTYPEILNYYQVATYEYDAAILINRDFRDDVVQQLGEAITMLSIKQIHGSLFKDIDGIRRGAFRTGEISITGAKVTPPNNDIEDYVRAFIKLTPKLVEKHSPIAALARVHTLFESIHPFPDGNGRVGRILMNFIAISLGLPPIIIKGSEQKERDRYYQALESADKGFHANFGSPTTMLKKLEQGDFKKLEMLLVDSVTPQLNIIIALAFEKYEPLKDLSELSKVLGIKEGTLRQRASRGSLITIKKDSKLYSHEKLLLR